MCKSCLVKFPRCGRSPMPRVALRDRSGRHLSQIPKSRVSVGEATAEPTGCRVRNAALQLSLPPQRSSSARTGAVVSRGEPLV